MKKIQPYTGGLNLAFLKETMNYVSSIAYFVQLIMAQSSELSRKTRFFPTLLSHVIPQPINFSI